MSTPTTARGALLRRAGTLLVAAALVGAPATSAFADPTASPAEPDRGGEPHGIRLGTPTPSARPSADGRAHHHQPVGHHVAEPQRPGPVAERQRVAHAPPAPRRQRTGHHLPQGRLGPVLAGRQRGRPAGPRTRRTSSSARSPRRRPLQLPGPPSRPSSTAATRSTRSSRSTGPGPARTRPTPRSPTSRPTSATTSAVTSSRALRGPDRQGPARGRRARR